MDIFLLRGKGVKTGVTKRATRLEKGTGKDVGIIN